MNSAASSRAPTLHPGAPRQGREGVPLLHPAAPLQGCEERHAHAAPQGPEDRNWRQDYFDRVRPVVGQGLLRRKLAVWDLGHGYLAAEALARTGLTSQVWFDDGPPRGAVVRSLGRQLSACASRGEALLCFCRDHNEWETDWDLTTAPPELDRLRACLGGTSRPDLLLARGGEGAGEIAAAAVEAGVPLVMTFVPAASSATAVQVVWLPEARCSAEAVVQACRRLEALPLLDLDRHENHIDGLEARSMALGLAWWILLRAGGATRADLELPIVEQGRCLVVRGQPSWPWAARFLSAGRGLDALLAELGRGGVRYRPPPDLLRGQRLLVLGLGTASLLCAEAHLVARRIVLVDGKEVSPYNPVRQVYGTRHVGRPKAEALAEILRDRLDPTTQWTAGQEGDVRYVSSGTQSIGAVRLHLTAADPDSEERFGVLLDQVQPTMAIVGMGRTRDDNFLATSELRRRGIRHITPSAFPGVTHFKHILTDGSLGPCYDCLQGHLMVDAGPGPTLTEAQRELFYGGTQPATLAETYPSAHSLLRLVHDLALPRGARPPYLLAELAAERACFVGANRAERTADGEWLYGVDQPFSLVTYGVEDLAAGTGAERPCSCGRVNR